MLTHTVTHTVTHTLTHAMPCSTDESNQDTVERQASSCHQVKVFRGSLVLLGFVTVYNRDPEVRCFRGFITE